MEAGEKEVFTGGEAGGGKSFLLILDALRYVKEPQYRAVIFRRTYPDLEELINEARQIYVPCGAKFNESKHNFTWPNGAIVMFRHLQHLKDIYSHQGKQYDFIGFDELPHFPKVAYTYLFSRLRGKNPNIKRYIRSTGNPDGEHVMWVKHRFVDSLSARGNGWFKTIKDRDVEVTPDTKGAISRRFIPCIRSENRILMDADPEYEDMLDNLPEATKNALKYGKWNVDDKPDQIIEGKWLENALLGENDFIDDGNFTVACDFGHTGKDMSVEFLGTGNRVYRCRSWNTTKTTEMADILSLTCGGLPRDRIRLGVDCIGPGAGVGDDIETHHSWLGPKLERCVEKDPLYEPKFKGEIVFDNLRSQMWWKFREDMQEGNIDMSAFMAKDIPPGEGEKLSPGEEDNGYFEDLYMLQEEIISHTFRVYKGKLIVISKDELRKAENLGRSPDYADALVIWNWTRRLHYEQGISTHDEYAVDEYMKHIMREDDLDDEGEYEDEIVTEDDYDEGIYDEIE